MAWRGRFGDFAALPGVPVGRLTLFALGVEMGDFNKRMALDVIEDVLSTLVTAEDRGLAMGLSGAFYMCGLLTHAEWEGILGRIAEGSGWGPELQVGVVH